MIAETVAQVFKKIGHTWAVVNKPGVVYSGPRFVPPTEDDIQRVLDEVPQAMYDSAVGDRLTVAGLMIEKMEDGFDVYVYTGNYKGE